jgi:hypothetical protein
MSHNPIHLAFPVGNRRSCLTVRAGVTAAAGYGDFFDPAAASRTVSIFAAVPDEEIFRKRFRVGLGANGRAQHLLNGV